jgi:hypothetical protein
VARSLSDLLLENWRFIGADPLHHPSYSPFGTCRAGEGARRSTICFG